jgi:hypothetical protein
MTGEATPQDTDFPFEAVMELVQICRADDALEARANQPKARQALVVAHVEDVAARYEIPPKQLALVTALLSDGRPIPEKLLKIDLSMSE